MFKVHDQKEFAKHIMPHYCRHSRYKSFLRQLSMYKFQRVTEGPNRGAYRHPHFLRNRIGLCELINRGEIKDVDLAADTGAANTTAAAPMVQRNSSRSLFRSDNCSGAIEQDIVAPDGCSTTGKKYAEAENLLGRRLGVTNTPATDVVPSLFDCFEDPSAETSPIGQPPCIGTDNTMTPLSGFPSPKANFAKCSFGSYMIPSAAVNIPPDVLDEIITTFVTKNKEVVSNNVTASSPMRLGVV